MMRCKGHRGRRKRIHMSNDKNYFYGDNYMDDVLPEFRKKSARATAKRNWKKMDR